MTDNKNFAPKLRVTGRNSWQNWHNTFDEPLKQYIDVWNGQANRISVKGYNATTRGLQSVIERALQTGDSVRARGGGWSLSKVAVTDGIMLNTRPLNYHFKIKPNQVHPNYTGDASNLLFVQCGKSIAALNRYLKRRGKSLKTSGASNGQTIAGAFSTGTHGSALDVGSVQDYVVGLHIIVSPEKTVWIERASNPIVSDAYARAFKADEIIRDDALFNAALISFGSFGLIHGVLLEVEDLFFLQATRKLLPINESLWQVCDSLNFAENTINLPRPNIQRPFHFQVVIDPYNTSEAYVTTMYKDEVRAADCQPSPPGNKITPGDNALEIVAAILDNAKELTPVVVSSLTREFYSQFENVCGTHGDIFTDTTPRGKSASAAVGIPLGTVQDAVKIAMDEIKAFPAPVLLALRYVRASSATLAFTSHSPITCILEIDGPLSERVKTIYNRIWGALDTAGIPYKFHWGKMNNLDALTVRKMYGEQKINAWLDARRKLLPTPELRRTFSNEFLIKLQLDS